MSKSWPLMPLREVTLPVERSEVPGAGTIYRQIGVKLWGGGAYERESIDGSQTRYKTLSRVEANDIIVNKIWARNGSVAVVSENLAGCYGSNEFPTFAPIQEKLEPRWFSWLTKTKDLWEQCDEKSRGTSGKNRIRPERFLEIRIPLPPLPEQRRIVARIEELAVKIEEARGLRRKTVEEAEALMASAITRTLDSLHLDSCLGDVLLEKPRNGWSARCDNVETGIPILSLGAVTGFRYRENEFKRTSEPTSPDALYWLKDGDLLITRSNTPELVGHAAIYSGSPSPCIYPDLMMRLVINEERADKRFVHCWLRSVPVREYVSRVAKGTSPTMKKISQGTVMNIPFPSGLSLPEQRRIVAYLDDLQAKVDALKRLQAETAAELNALLPSVLDKAFKGEL